jgi:hypothetical protein
MASAGPAAGRAASTATAPASSGWRSGIPAMPSVGPGTQFDHVPVAFLLLAVGSLVLRVASP